MSERLGSSSAGRQPALAQHPHQRMSSHKRTAKIQNVDNLLNRLDHVPVRHASGAGRRGWEPRGTELRHGMISGGQASKGIRWMPWHQEAMKDVAKLRKVAESRKQASTRKSPNRETDVESCRRIPGLNT